jgi:tetratricopeptide (TPR) repeat protein
VGAIACIWLIFLLLRPSRQGEERRYVFEGFFWLLLAGFFWTCLQILPLPSALLRWISPQAHEVFTQILTPLGLYSEGAFRALSLSIPETLAKLLRDVGLLALFVAALQWGHTHWHLRAFLRFTVIGAAVIAGLVILQTILRIPQPLMGMYNPQFHLHTFLQGSPLINQNHLGGYLLFHSLLAYTLALDSEDFWEKISWAAAGAVMGILVLLTLSRAAVIAYLLALFAFLWLVGSAMAKGQLGRKHKEEEEDDEEGKKKPQRGRWGFLEQIWKQPALRALVLLFFVMVGVGVELSSGALVQEFEQTSVSLRKDKLAAILEFSLPLLREYPWVGVGRGAMGMAWPRFSSADMLTKGRLTPTHVESFAIQPLVDWGILFGVFWVICFFWLFWRLWSGSRGFLEHACMIALFALLLQNMADFNLEFPATAFPFFLLLAILKRQQCSRKKMPTTHKPTFLAVIGLAGLVMIVSIFSHAFTYSYRKIHIVWSQIEKQEGEAFKASLQRLVSLRPSDYVLAVLAARHYSTGKRWEPELALQWLERAAYLNPTAGNILLLRGYVYARLGLYQDACRALERAVKLSPDILLAAAHIVEQFGFYEHALRLFRDRDLMVRVLRGLLQKEERGALLLKWKKHLIRRFPKEIEIYRAILTLKLQQAYKEEKEDREKAMAILKDARALLWRVFEQMPKEKSFFALFSGHILREQGDFAGAVRYYRQAMKEKESPDYWRAFFSLMRLYVRLRQEDAVYKMFMKGRRLTHNLNHQGELFFLYARLLTRRYAYRAALEAYERAVHYNPRPAHYWFALADVAAQMGLYDRSLEIFERYRVNPLYRESMEKKIKQVKEMMQAERGRKGLRDIYGEQKKQ